ncbi:MAG TPA: hypothetical protein VHG11_05780 [Pseudorhizobium sp.]|nr:hypothetical protein [Pseudorhizobium sp.]
MAGITIAARFGLAAAIVLGHAHSVWPQSDAFKSFKQLDSTSKMPKLNAFSAPLAAQAGPAAKDVTLQAKLTTADEETVEEGLTWRVFSPVSGADGKLPLVASSEGGGASFQLAPGDYFVNVAFGRAGVTKKLSIPAEGDVEKQVLVLDAGGVLLDATAGSDTLVPENQLSFSIYSSEVRQNGERGLVMADVKPNTIVRLNAGTYHVVSEYGDVNAVVRADIQVEAGKLVEATLQHRAAQITLKLVSQPGGEAIADTAWSVLTATGDIVNESVSAFSTMVLAEGEYLAVARNKDKIYQRSFTVAAGKNIDVEVMMKEQPNIDLFSNAELRE